jgi:hypothetical protein
MLSFDLLIRDIFGILCENAKKNLDRKTSLLLFICDRDQLLACFQSCSDFTTEVPRRGQVNLKMTDKAQYEPFLQISESIFTA